MRDDIIKDIEAELSDIEEFSSVIEICVKNLSILLDELKEKE